MATSIVLRTKLGSGEIYHKFCFFLVDVLMLLLIIVRGVAGREKKTRKENKKETNWLVVGVKQSQLKP